jgi:hypothetical protein
VPRHCTARDLVVHHRKPMRIKVHPNSPSIARRALKYERKLHEALAIAAKRAVRYDARLVAQPQPETRSVLDDEIQKSVNDACTRSRDRQQEPHEKGNGAHMRTVAALAISILLRTSFSDDPHSTLDAPREFFAKRQIGTSPDYAIIKFGNPRDHVATVHGFTEDGSSCREIAEAMNFNACKETDGQNCLYPYSCDALN